MAWDADLYPEGRFAGAYASDFGAENNQTMTSANYTISLNCDPAGPRPPKLLRTLIEGLSLTLDAEYPTDTSMGNWVWIIPLDQHEQYIKVRGIVEQRIAKLYEAKLIRYGSW